MVFWVLRAALKRRIRGAIGCPCWAKLRAAPDLGSRTGSRVLKRGSAGAARPHHLWSPRIWAEIIFFPGPSHALRLAGVGLRRPA